MLAVKQDKRRAFISLDHVGGLSPQPTNVVLLSDRSLHILQNFSITDIQQSERYALGFAKEYYWAVTPFDNSDWQLYQSLYRELQRELVPVNLYGYQEVRNKRATHTLPSGTTNKELVPAEAEGEMIEVQAVGILIAGTPPTRIELFHQRNSNFGCLATFPSPAADTQWNAWSGKVVCDEESSIFVNLYGCTNGTTLYLDMVGVLLVDDGT